MHTAPSPRCPTLDQGREDSGAAASSVVRSASRAGARDALSRKGSTHMKLSKWWRGDGEPALHPGRALLCGTGLAGVLFGNLMVPSYGAGDLAAHGIPVAQVVALAAVANLAVAVAGLILAMTGWQPRWPWVSGAMALAAGGLLVPLVLPVEHDTFVLLTAGALAVYGFAAGFGQLTEQTEAVAGVDVRRRSEAVGSIMRLHLVGGVVIGGLPILFSWQVGQIALIVTFLGLAGVVAKRRREPAPAKRERYSLGRLVHETGPGSAIVAVGQAAWVVMYLLPGLHAMQDWAIGVYAVVAQLVAAWAMGRLGAWADENRPRVAKLSGSVLLIAIVGVAIFPATFTHGEWYGLAAFVVGEVCANVFISAIEGHISVEEGGRRAQLMGHVTKYAAVGVAGAIVTILAWQLVPWLGATGGAVGLGVIVAGAFGLLFVWGFSRLRIRDDGLAA